MNYYYMNFRHSGSLNSYVEVIYPLTSDADAPTSSHVPYSDLTTYVEESAHSLPRLPICLESTPLQPME